MNLKYEDFINGINNRIIKQINFKVLTYPHYNDCSIGRYVERIKIGKEEKLMNHRITCILTKDHYEDISSFDKFKENHKLFKIKGKGKFTLKEMWDKIEILSITYFNKNRGE